MIHPETNGEVHGKRWCSGGQKAFPRCFEDCLAVRGKTAYSTGYGVMLQQWRRGVLAKKVSGAHNGAIGSRFTRLGSSRIFLYAMTEPKKLPSIIVADADEQSVNILSITRKDF